MMKQPMREKDSQTIDKENEREREESLSDNAYSNKIAYSTRQEKEQMREREREEKKI